MDENKTTDPVALFDQMGALLANCAVMFGQYHKSLLDNNIPIQLAVQNDWRLADDDTRKTAGAKRVKKILARLADWIFGKPKDVGVIGHGPLPPGLIILDLSQYRDSAKIEELRREFEEKIGWNK